MRRGWYIKECWGVKLWSELPMSISLQRVMTSIECHSFLEGFLRRLGKSLGSLSGGSLVSWEGVGPPLTFPREAVVVGISVQLILIKGRKINFVSPMHLLCPTYLHLIKRLSPTPLSCYSYDHFKDGKLGLWEITLTPRGASKSNLDLGVQHDLTHFKAH